MNKELLERLQQEARELQGKIDKLRDIERLMAEMNMDSGYNLHRKLEDIGFDFNQALRTLTTTPDTVTADVYTAANFSVTNDMAKQTYVTSSIADLYINAMANLVTIESQVNAGSISYFEAMQQLKGVVLSVSPYSNNVRNISDINFNEMVTAFGSVVTETYNKYQQHLTPEQRQEITNSKVETIPIKTDSELESMINDNTRLQQQTLDMKASSKDDNQFDSVAEDVLEKFKKLNNSLEVDSYGGSINFDPDEVMFALRGLQDSVFDLNAMSNRNTNDTSYTRYLSDMSVVFSEKTNKTRSALSDFQTNTFESSIPQIRKLIEETKSQEEKSEILKKFTKSAAWYMHSALLVQGQSNEHVNQVLNDVNDIIKSSNTIATQHEYEAAEFQREQTSAVRKEMRRQVNETVIEQIQNSAVGSTLTKKEIEDMAEEITDEALADSNVQAATTEAVSEAVNNAQENITTTTEQVVKNIVEEKVESKVEEVVETIVEEKVEKIIENKQQEQVEENKPQNLDFLDRIDIDNTPVIKTEEEIKEDMKWHMISTMITTELSDTTKYSDIDPDTIKTSTTALKHAAFDKGCVIKMKDGSVIRSQEAVRNLCVGNISNEEFIERVADPENTEFKEIISGVEFVKRVVGTDNIKKFGNEIEKTKTFENTVKTLMPGEYSSERSYYGIFTEQTMGINPTYSNFETSDYSNILTDISRQINDGFTQFRIATAQTQVMPESSSFIEQRIQTLEQNIQNIEEQILTQGLSPNKPTTFNPISNTTTTPNHPLDRYKALFEQYDIQSYQGGFVALDRTTGQPPQYSSREQMDTLIRDLTFARSWVASCGTDLSKTGGTNEYGIDPRQWEYSFNDGAKETFDNIINVLKNTNGSIPTQNLTDYISQNSNYKYADSITESLLRDRNNKAILESIQQALLNEAGLSPTINQNTTDIDFEM